jgi:hypothetical protein
VLITPTRRGYIISGDAKFEGGRKHMPIEEDKLKLDLYLDMYNEHATQARHHENLRGVISKILISISAGIFITSISECC